MTSLGQVLSGCLVRPYTRDDVDQVLDLIEVDRLPGQPAASEQSLTESVMGHSADEAHLGWWAQPADLRTDVLVSTAHGGQQVLGVASYARWRGDFAGTLLWLFAREQPLAVALLIQHVLTQLASCRHIYAFDLITPLTSGTAALPIQRRPVTSLALRTSGFRMIGLNRYLHRDLRLPDTRRNNPPSDTHVAGPSEPDTCGWSRVEAIRDGVIVGQIAFTATLGRYAHLQWIISPPHNPYGHRVGHALLNTTLIHLRDTGSNDIVVHVQPSTVEEGHRDITEQLHIEAGFTELDSLAYFTRGPEHHGPAESFQQLRNPPRVHTTAHLVPVGENTDRTPLQRMLSTLHTEYGKTYVLDPGASPLAPTQETIRALCDALEAIHRNRA